MGGAHAQHLLQQRVIQQGGAAQLSPIAPLAAADHVVDGGEGEPPDDSGGGGAWNQRHRVILNSRIIRRRRMACTLRRPARTDFCQNENRRHKPAIFFGSQGVRCSLANPARIAACTGVIGRGLANLREFHEIFHKNCKKPKKPSLSVLCRPGKVRFPSSFSASDR